MSVFGGRRAGVLLHVTSLPGRFGIGDAGLEALRTFDWLRAAGQSIWQVLPLGPTGFGDSPYQCFSSFAGNPLLVSPEGLLADGDLEPGDLEAAPRFDGERVDYGPVIEWKEPLLRRAFERFRERAPAARREPFEAFRAANATWLDDYALFMAL